MLRVFHEEGVGAEVKSDCELRLAFRLGVPPGKIVFNGLGKSVETLELAVEKGDAEDRLHGRGCGFRSQRQQFLFS